MDKVTYVDKILEHLKANPKIAKYYLAIKNAILRHLYDLGDVDISSIVQSLADYIDSSLSDEENRKIIEEYISRYANGYARLDYAEIEESMESTELISTIDSIIEDLRRLRERVREIDKRRALIAEKIGKLLYHKGYLERKPIRGRNGKTYYYWYLRYYENGRKRSKYVGKEVSEELERLLRNWRRYKMLAKRLRELQRELERIEKAIERADRALWGVV